MTKKIRINSIIAPRIVSNTTPRRINKISNSLLRTIINTVFGWQEIGAREILKRERGRRCPTSPVWETEEKGERDQNWWGLPLLGLFAQMRTKWEEVPFILDFPFLPMSLSMVSFYTLYFCYTASQQHLHHFHSYTWVFLMLKGTISIHLFCLIKTMCTLCACLLSVEEELRHRKQEESGRGSAVC